MRYRKIGILGGMGPEATAELYLRIIRIFQQRYGAVYDSDFPEIIIINLPLPDTVENVCEDDRVKDMLIEGARKLEAAGADFISIPCNTVTSYLPELANAVSIPIINIVQETTNEIAQRQIKKVGLLGTYATIRSKVYENAMLDAKVIPLGEPEQKIVTQIIINILAGKKSIEDRELLNAYIENLKKRGAEKVILGCTELPLIITNNRDALDTLQILAEASVRESTNCVYDFNTTVY